jgi:glutathione S-transferase
MLKLYHAPRTRSARIYWLLEELGIPYELETIAFVPPLTAFSQRTPVGKVPVLEDVDVTVCESGAIVEYVLERHGNGRLAPPVGSPLRGPYLQWIHFAEATLMTPLGHMAFEMLWKPEADRIPAVIEEARVRAESTLAVVEQALAGKDYLLGKDFSGADVMMGYTIQVARWMGVLGEQYPNLTAYLKRLRERPAFRKALE